MGLTIVGYAASTGELREIYDRMLARDAPPVYRPVHGGIAGIIEAHSLDPVLIPKVFGASSTINQAGPLTFPERELIDSIVSRMNQCSYCTSCHVEFLRVALDGAHPDLPAQVIASPRAEVTASPRMRMLAELARLVTEEPWTISRTHRANAHVSGLSDDDILHAITLAAIFGHFNRIANAIDVPLDYTVTLAAPPPDPSTPPFPQAPIAVSAKPALELSRRPATAAALSAWRSYMFDRDAPLTRRSRTVIARWVAQWLGDGGISAPTDLTVNPVDDALRELAEQVTLAPWQLGDHSFTRLRTGGFSDAQLFDAVAVASSTGVFSRITVALGAMARERG